MQYRLQKNVPNGNLISCMYVQIGIAKQKSKGKERTESTVELPVGSNKLNNLIIHVSDFIYLAVQF